MRHRGDGMEFEVWAVRAWFSVQIVKGVRTGISVNANPAARVYRVSATDAHVHGA
jgi:hypothetical protein